MHPDLKVGLALAMLIVGFAGAMCFRHRPLDDVARVETLAVNADLGAEMELLPVRTYAPELPPENSVEAEALTEILPTADGELVIPEPIPPSEIAESAPAEADLPAAREQPPASAAGSTYVVRSGDTLSGIAARLLGSTQRYEEIFEANRHLLNSPDDLRPGMELVIPPKEPPAESPNVDAAPPATAAAEESDGAQEPTPAAPPIVERFTPIVPR
jgi:LysM repeat protein